MASKAPRSVLTAAIAGLVLVALAWLGASAATPFHGTVTRVVASMGGLVGPLLLVAVLFAIAASVFGAGTGVRPLDRVEEPLIRPPQMPRTPRKSPVVSLIGIESGCGTSTLAFNLSAAVASLGSVGVEGGRRLARPVCLMADGQLSQAMGLSAEPVATYVADHPGYIKTDILDLVVSHIAGLDLLCVDSGQLETTQLARLLEILRKEYDAVILDCQFGAERLATAAAHHGDVVLLCGLATATSSSAAANWAVRCWDLGEERRTAMVVNRRSGSSMPGELNAGFLYRAEVPENPLVSACDVVGTPWAVEFDSPAADALAQLAAGVLPELLVQETTNAA
jgi:MinD-like ATPase involved in chromosome partitioning or flagellar assembly